MDQDLDLAQLYRGVLRRWPKISLAMVAGGILGLIASFGLPPLYQSSAVIDLGVDYNRTAPMRDLTLEQAYDRVRGLLLADTTLQEAIRRAGGRIDVVEMRSRIRLARRLGGWELFVDGQDPPETAALANAWAEVAIARIDEAMAHAVRAAEWQWALYLASCVLQPDETAPGTAIWVCRSDAEEGDPESVPAALLEEAALSHGILPIFSYSVLKEASVPVRPVLWNRASLVLGGMIAGGVTGFAWAVLEPRGQEARDDEGSPRRRPRQKGSRRGC